MCLNDVQRRYDFILASVEDPISSTLGVNLLPFHCGDQLVIAVDYAAKLLSH